MKQKYDVIVIGSGPGGQKAAVQAAKKRKKVSIIEKEKNVGGSCVYKGTIPSKTLRETALTMANLKRSSHSLNFQLNEEMEVASLMERLEKVLTEYNTVIRNHFRDNSIDLIHGKARLIDKNVVEVQSIDGTRTQYHAEIIVIATGSRPREPSDISIDHENILDSDSILHMIYIPRSLTVLGGGVIASEYASIFSLLGTKVTIIDKAPRPLMFLDPELTDKFLSHFTRNGGRYIGNHQYKSVVWDGVSQVITELDNGEIIKSDKILFAMGRVANVESLQLNSIDVEQTKRGHIAVDENYMTSVDSIYAVGDVIGFPSLASCSMEQGRRAMCHALKIDPGHPFEIVPMGIYAVPEISSVGIDEQQAKEKYGGCTVGHADFKETARGQISDIQDGLLKIVADKEGKKLLGIQIIGEGACELIHIGEMTLLNNNDVAVFLENIMNFPTLGEAYRVAALNLINKGIKR